MFILWKELGIKTRKGDTEMVKIITKKYVINSEGNAECTNAEVTHVDIDGNDALELVKEVNTTESCDDQIERDNDGNIVFMKVSYATFS